jgi:N-acetylneuraminic acid mutarotase
MGESFKTVEEYDPSIDQWTTKTDMPIARLGHSAELVDGKIYVFGGTEDINFVSLNSVNVYDPFTDIWSTRTSIPTARFVFSTSVVEGNVYLFGGRDGQNCFSTVEEYITSIDSWITKTSIPTVTWGASASLVDGKIYVVGGCNGIPVPIISTLLEYDPTLDPTSVEEPGNKYIRPSEYSLLQNYPNPFNPSTILSWHSPVGSWQTLKVYDVIGKEVATLVDEYKPAGTYEVEFNAANHSVNVRNLPAGRQGLTSGVYFYQLSAGNFVETKKMLLIK